MHATVTRMAKYRSPFAATLTGHLLKNVTARSELTNGHGTETWPRYGVCEHGC
jgi:hypothetical protein